MGPAICEGEKGSKQSKVKEVFDWFAASVDINYVVDKFKSKKADAQRQKDVNSRTLPGLDLRHVSELATSGNGGKKATSK
ncbi:MAG: hypothetical protein IPL73_18555 [Candidatus Obscuribacter sp.]|nr:hypothetical protein [Candidatus Obscuribacter sp.]